MFIKYLNQFENSNSHLDQLREGSKLYDGIDLKFRDKIHTKITVRHLHQKYFSNNIFERKAVVL